MKQSNTWQIVERFVDPSNKELLAALKHGVNGLQISFSKLPSREELLDVFQGIHHEMVEYYLDNDEKLAHLLHKVIAKEAHQLVAKISSANFESDLSIFLAQARIMLEEDQLMVKPYLIFEPSNLYVENIAKIRTLKLLWEHILRSFSLEAPAISVISHISTDQESNSFEEDFIFNSIKLMSCSIASSEGIEIDITPKSEKDYDFKARITRNLHHLAKEEAYMDLVKDPLRGSYYIEERSTAYARDAWNKFIQ